MAEQAKLVPSRNGAGFRPTAMVVAVAVTVALLALFDLLSHAHF
ncbi:MAG TPA: hypothetical protein VL752_00810 [Acidisoma sp.]|jgi:hypothetical protein|nr:hypothetical protein [Acidisoma sp.]HTH99456.1 hypothetical protein [Acidisoma sp.]